MPPARMAAFFVFFSACTPTGAPKSPTVNPGDDLRDSTPETVDSHDSTMVEDSGDSAIPELPAYCRSQDPNWINAYQEPLDQELAALIAAQGLEGDPALYVDENGVCRRRVLPSISDALSVLGRSLFFTMDLSGDRDTACASCHHPLLGGGDAISLSMGPSDHPNAMGADRVRGLSDASQIFVPRNAPTTFNVAFWDSGLFWDARVAALNPDAGFNGEVGGITSPDVSDVRMADPDAGPNLPATQAAFPVTEAHEMAGSWASLYGDRAAIRDALAARLAMDPMWVARFEAVCGQAGLSASWQAACALPTGADRDAALVTFSHVTEAIAAYERSQVFTQSPWQAYVQGDVHAISDGAKQGALLFYRSVADGGQNCFACHKGDFFTDEDFHGIGTPQIGPGKLDGEDLGRSGVTGDEAMIFKFRTPTLLNVAVTAPYSHSGAYATLEKAIAHYDNPNGRLLEYFGEGNKSDLNIRPWCAMTEFAGIPDCANLYVIDHTDRGNVNLYVAPELEGIKTLENHATVYLGAFLETLTDPIVRDSVALAPWVDAGSSLEVTETSSEWEYYCDTMIERSADINLHNKGLRWLATGGIVDGGDVNTGQVLYDVFGVHYWELFDTAFTANSGVDQDDAQLAIATLEVLTPGQRAILTTAYAEMTTRGNHPAILSLRQELFSRMNDRRAGAVVDDSEFASLIATAATLEAEDLATMVRAYRDMAALGGASAREAEIATFRAIQEGNFSALPVGVYIKGEDSLLQTSSIKDEVRAVTRSGTIPWDTFAAGYSTWSTGWDCRYRFMSRLADADRRSNYYGFTSWANNYLFDLDTGKAGSGDFEKQMSEYVATRDQALGLSDLFASTLTDSIQIRNDYDAARASLVDALVAATSATDDAAAEAAIVAANAAVASADAHLLASELNYYVRLAQAETAAGSTRLADYVACIESPETQAMKGAGGFDALGGGSCEPN